jgi:serine protease Do
MRLLRRLFVLHVIFILLSTGLSAEVKDYVVIIRQKLHEKTIDTFLSVADYYEEKGEPELAGIFRAIAEGGHGSGFVFVDEDGENYIITNRHVVNFAENIDIEVETKEGKIKTYTDCPILYIDRNLDLAVVQFPEGEKVYSEGLELDTDFKEDGLIVWSAGFPTLLGKPGWQFAQGNITNSKAFIQEMVDSDITYLIQHSATIDPGNSGGPLLVKSDDSVIGYKVIGVNTWSIMGRQNTFFSIPSKCVQELLVQVKQLKEKLGDEERMKEDLIRNCQILAAELGSEHPDWEKIKNYISYAFVSNKGWASFIKILNMVDREEGEKWNESFFTYSPFETMRMAIYYLMWLRIKQDKGSVNVKYESINFADLDKIDTLYDIRTNFLVDDEQVEIVWSFEYGHWHVSDMMLEAGEKDLETEESVLITVEEERPKKERNGLRIAGIVLGTIGLSGTFFSIIFNMDSVSTNLTDNYNSYSSLKYSTFGSLIGGVILTVSGTIMVIVSYIKDAREKKVQDSIEIEKLDIQLNLFNGIGLTIRY